MLPFNKMALLIGLVVALLVGGVQGDSCGVSSCAALQIKYANTVTFNNVCNSTNSCNNTAPFDNIFIVDGSLSINSDIFYTTMLDFLEAAFCSFGGQSGKNRFGVVIFGGQVRVAVPLAFYTEYDWFCQIEGMRSNPTTCCSCCTPSAEAFDLTRTEFINHGLYLPGDTLRIRNAIIVSDGNPWQVS